MKNDAQFIGTIVKLWESVLAGEIEPTEALRHWPEDLSARDHLIEESRHVLDHYASDADIHRTNPEYERQQRKQIETCLGR